ncbi:MAG: hypothetical protein JKX82_05985 [Oleispira sp.]|nr:hypothetical protein [Oleispira sp.]
MIKTESSFQDIERKIINELRGAKKSIRICVAWLNTDIYGPVLVDAITNGVTVEIIVNDDANNEKSISALNPSIKIEKVKVSGGLMHNKFCIIDESIVINGSYNWSNNAKNHLENIVIIRNDFELSRSFMHEFYLMRDYITSIQNRKKRNSCSISGCRFGVFNVGILGRESGQYCDSQVDIWEICKGNDHAIKIRSVDEQHLLAQLGLIDNPNHEEYWEITEENMVEVVELQRKDDQVVKDYFETMCGLNIHAIGCVAELNANEFLEGYANLMEYGINIIWKDIVYRESIPDQYLDGCGDIDDIIKEHI